MKIFPGQFIAGYALTAFLYCAVLMIVKIDLSDELLILLVIPIIYASQIYPRYVYVTSAVIGIVYAEISLIIFFNSFTNKFFSDSTLVIMSVVMFALGELIYRKAEALRVSEAEKEKLIDDLQKALAQVKTLSGLLPICSCCKKIRDDQGYWNQIEEYILQHSEAEFTHGICPDCLQKEYPAYFKEFKKRQAEAANATSSLHP